MSRRASSAILAFIGLGYVLSLVGVELHARTIPFAAETSRLAAGPVHAVVFYHDEAIQRSERIRHGIERFRAGAVDGLIMVGGYRQSRSEPGARLMVVEAERSGVSGQRLQQDMKSYDTKSNLSAAGDILRRSGSVGAELISDRLHLARIRLSIDELAFEGDIRYVSSGRGAEGVVPTFVRLNYELAAYVLLLLPRSLSDWLTVRVREASAIVQ